MKNGNSISRRQFLKGAAATAMGASLLGVTGVAALAEEEGVYIPGTYSAMGVGMGTVTVTMTFDANHIIDVKLDVSEETPTIGGAQGETLAAQIMDAQDSNIDGVTGASLTSEAARTAAAACIAQARREPVIIPVEAEVKEKAAEEAAEEIEVSATKDTDVVIVGAGACGLMAALKCDKAGLKVVLVEKSSTLYTSNFANCGGPAARGSSVQKDAGVELSADEMFNHMVDYARGGVNAALLKNVLGCTGEAVDTLRDLGVEFSLDEDVYGVGFRARHYIVDGCDRIAAIQTGLDASGIDLMLNTAAKSILMDGERACGVQVQCADKTYMNINARAVLICTGGFQGDQGMIKRFFGGVNCVSLGNNLSNGDGIRMVEAAGGVTDRNFAVLGNEGGGTSSKVKGAIYNWENWTIVNQNLCFGIYGGLMVDGTGSRFCNEKKIADFPLATGGELLIRNGKSYAVMDSAMYDACCEEGIFKFYGEPEQDWVAGMALWWPVLDEAKDKLQTAIDEGWAYKADSVRELAAYFDLAELEATVEKYNSYCEAGRDADYGKPAFMLKPVKEGPFYIFEYEGATWSTNGGMKVDAKLRALKEGSAYIPGLYIGGVEAGSMYASPYYDNPGSSVGLAVGSGVWAARQIEEYIRG